MNFFKRVCATLVIASSFAAPSSAATLTNWFVDTDGAGGNAAFLVQDFLDLVGGAYINNTFTSATTFNFNEFGSFTAATADGGSNVGGVNLVPNLTATFTAAGSGTTGAPGGTLNFSTGQLQVFSGATNVGTFNLQAGSANLIANSTLPNGTVSLIFAATSLAQGYFFNSGLQDLADLLAADTVTLGFVTTNVISLANGTRTVESSLVAGYNANFNPDVGPIIVANNTTDLFLSNNGQFRVSLPEPGTLALLGVGVMGLAFGARRRKQA